MQGFVIPIRFRMFQSETYLRENEILEKKKIFKCMFSKPRTQEFQKLINKHAIAMNLLGRFL